MKVITKNTIQLLSESSVVTIGNFDGLHLGHKALINRCIELAGVGSEVAVVSFEPLPQAFFSPDDAPARLTGSDKKLELLEQSGVDLVWLMRFDRELAKLGAASFVKSVIVDALSATHVVVGQDFRFGKGREGNLEMLKSLGAQLGFSVATVGDFLLEGSRVSSSKVRQMLALGNFDGAEKYLGRRFTLQGEVIQGSQLGRKLGYPTANIKPQAEPCPLSGVFAIRTRISDEKQWRNSVASLGTRPAIGGTEFLIEVHVFDFSAELYGQQIEVNFIAKIRDEEDFDSMDALITQMNIDEAQARQILKDK